jgi:hypothetical protein
MKSSKKKKNSTEVGREMKIIILTSGEIKNRPASTDSRKSEIFARCQLEWRKKFFHFKMETQ